MRNLYVVEGPDCSGKTTLAKYITCALNGTYHHMSGSPAYHTLMQKYHFDKFDDIEWNIRNVSLSVHVLDRSWPSEIVYGREFRPHFVGAFDWQVLDERMKHLDVAYIFCMDDQVVERHEEQKDQNHPYDRAAFQGVVAGYKTLMDEMIARRGDCYHYDLTQHGASIRAFMERMG